MFNRRQFLGRSAATTAGVAVGASLFQRLGFAKIIANKPTFTKGRNTLTTHTFQRTGPSGHPVTASVYITREKRYNGVHLIRRINGIETNTPISQDEFLVHTNALPCSPIGKATDNLEEAIAETKRLAKVAHSVGWQKA